LHKQNSRGIRKGPKKIPNPGKFLRVREAEERPPQSKPKNDKKTSRKDTRINQSHNYAGFLHTKEKDGKKEEGIKFEEGRELGKVNRPDKVPKWARRGGHV